MYTFPAISDHEMSGQATLVGRGDDDADQIRWDRAVCKGAGLLDAMAGDEKTAGSHFKPPRESGESEYQDYRELKNIAHGLDVGVRKLTD
jgi:hypothetical protein